MAAPGSQWSLLVYIIRRSVNYAATLSALLSKPEFLFYLLKDPHLVMSNPHILFEKNYVDDVAGHFDVHCVNDSNQ